VSAHEPSDAPGIGPEQHRQDEKLRALAIALMPHLPKNGEEARRVVMLLADLITYRETGQMPLIEREEPVGQEGTSEKHARSGELDAEREG
jgi:hypothetical protein